MKYIIIISLLLVSCQKQGCYEFTTVQTVTASPHVAGYPQTTSVKTTQCSITESEAKKAAQDLTNTSSTYTAGYFITVTKKTTYKLVQ